MLFIKGHIITSTDALFLFWKDYFLEQFYIYKKIEKIVEFSYNLSPSFPYINILHMCGTFVTINEPTWINYP